MASFDVSMHGKQLNFAPSQERSARRPARTEEDEQTADDNAKTTGKPKTDDGTGRVWMRPTGLPMDVCRMVLPWTLPHVTCVRVLQIVVVVLLVFDIVAKDSWWLEGGMRVNVQGLLRRLAALALCCVVDVSALLSFHACVVVLMIQIGQPADESLIATPTLVACVSVTVHRCAVHPLRMWLMLLVAVAAGSAVLSMLALSLMSPGQLWLSEVMFVGLSGVVYAAVHFNSQAK